MTEAIITALITGAFAFLGVAYSNRKTAALIEYRIKELEKKQDKHNSVIERTYQLEQRVAVLEERSKDA